MPAACVAPGVVEPPGVAPGFVEPPGCSEGVDADARVTDASAWPGSTLTTRDPSALSVTLAL